MDTVGKNKAKIAEYIRNLLKKPIIGAINGSRSNFIINNDVGYFCPSGDFNSLAEIIKNTTIDDLQQIGRCSKEVYFRKYSKSIFMKKLSGFLDELVNKKNV